MANEIDIDIGTFNLDTTNQIAISSINMKVAKRLAEAKIPKAHGSIIPVAKRGSLSVRIAGTIIGTDYDNLRSNLDDLNAAFESASEQKLTLDDDRYLMVQYKDFSTVRHGPQANLRTLASFSVSLIASYPIWLSEALSSDTRVPTSGVGYAINNPGNAPARVKVTITAPAGGITDNCQLENITNDELLKYRGTIAATKDLIINDRVDQDDMTVENDGDEDWANFEGDFITLDPGNNTIEFTGESGTQVKLQWRDAYL